MLNNKSLIQQWAIRAIVLYLVFFALNSFVFTSDNALDKWLTRFTAESSGKIAKWAIGDSSKISLDRQSGGATLHYQDNSYVFVGHGCNARDIFFLYIGFLLSIPLGSVHRKLGYLGVGLLLIWLFNVIRVFLLLMVAQHMPAFFDFIHKYLFQVSIYILLLVLWHYYLQPFGSKVTVVEDTAKSDVNKATAAEIVQEYYSELEKSANN